MKLAVLVWATSSLFSADDDMATRIAALKPFFDPPPGGNVEIGIKEIRARNPNESVDRLPGFIRVRPPSGTCFWIRRSPSSPDERICKPKRLVFFAHQLERSGLLRWTVRVSPEDFGTELTWQTPHRIGRAVTIGHKIAGHSYSVYIQSCKSEQDAVSGRRIRLGLLSGEEWVIKLPPKDQLLPQPAPFPNLFVQGDRGPRGGIPVSGVKSLFSMKEEKSALARAQGDDVFDDPRKLKPRPALPLMNYWEIHPRDAYHMNASYFLGSYPVPPGPFGQCRYKFGGYQGDPNVGHVECQVTAQFQWVHIPLACLKDLGPRH